ncbi:hypothetical protein SAMN04489761_1700 [Tenacibaculum sp. MAR_2009_124]|uniref:hypothetical protein n=1 Tax=Tenacibaculum sp. MAR_2009_124 TaxID=1250059 RepID=UPI00089D4A9A|nr:hypothetical protein [Tenacibaculum sp. MAR_2009_124]SEB76444.1 hypothetical protein SAMN04489761_1700 [Tenacibaculum sp. MAR_2009_124]
MKNKVRNLIGPLLICFLFINCSENGSEDCTKTITIPQFYMVNGQTYNYSTTQEVPCDLPDIQEPQQIDLPPQLESFTYEIIRFEYTPDTGNNTSRLQFEIKLMNNSDANVNGFPYLTIKSDGLQFSTSYSSSASEPCLSLAANSFCTMTFDTESSLDLGAPTSMELLDIVYYLTN